MKLMYDLGAENQAALDAAVIEGERLMYCIPFNIYGESFVDGYTAVTNFRIYCLLKGRIVGQYELAKCTDFSTSVMYGNCAFYAVMTGAGPSIVRALLFVAINEALRHSPGRRRSPLAIWCCALVIQLAVSPWVIRSVGFQLSYLAMLGIVTLFPALDAWFPSESRYSGPMKRIWSAMALTISCQLFTAPLVWIRFHSFPTHFLLTNLLALPLVSMLMFCAVATLVLTAAGLCPGVLLAFTDTLAGLLLTAISLIAGL